VIVAAAICPHPPLLLREVTGVTDPAPDLRAACRDAVTRLLAARPDVVVVVGADGPPVTPTSFAPPPHSSVIMHVRRPAARPLSLLVGERLLAEAGRDGDTRFLAVGPDAAPAECARLGAELAEGSDRTALLVMGDGSARRGPKAPGYVDGRAQPFDATVLDAVGAGDLPVLRGLDPALAADLLVAGRAAWQVLAGAVPDGAHSEVLYADDPFGVQYLVAALLPG
jgi:hypothetical protein